MPDATFPEDDEWIALVRAPEGLTVIREAWGQDAGQRWVGFYGDDAHGNAHGFDLPGMLAAVVAPLAAAEVPVFVASTFHADLVLVPMERHRDAVTALEDAGHEIVGG
ncbi:MAG: ACT domain-containing protein [Actinomadura sp.]